MITYHQLFVPLPLISLKFRFLATFMRCPNVLNGMLLSRRKSKHSRRMIHGRLLIFQKTRKHLGANGYLSWNIRQMVALIDIRLDLLLKDSVNLMALTMTKHFPQWLNSTQFVSSFHWLLILTGLFTNSMWKMPSSMVTWRKKFLWISLLPSRLHQTPTRCASSRNPYTNSSNLFKLGSKDSWKQSTGMVLPMSIRSYYVF